MTLLIYSEEFKGMLQCKSQALSRLLARLQKVAGLAEVDRAVVYGILAGAWSLVAGPVTVLLIATHFEPALQGFYYTFNSLLALQVFVELGLGAVIAQFASHEWSKLNLDGRGRIVGEPEALSRLVSLGRIAFLWYLVGGGIVAVGLGLAGFIFFSQQVYPGIGWVAPWFVLCLLSGVNLWLAPVWSLLGGCNQVSQVNLFRFIQGILNTLSICVGIVLGAGLWVAAISLSIGIAWSGIFLTWQYRSFFLPFFSRPARLQISWSVEIWPMQWRIAVSWLSGYFMFWLFTPVLFHYHGAVVAGQMGMTWSLLFTLSAISSVWYAANAPRFGMLVAKKQYAELDRLFFRVTTVSITVACVGAVALWSAVYLLNVLNFSLAARLLPPLPTGVFVMGQIAMLATAPLSVYLRAHKREPFFGLSVWTAVLVGLSTWLLGSRFAAMGAAVGYLVVSAFFNLPFAIVIWCRCRAAWHSETLVFESPTS